MGENMQTNRVDWPNQISKNLGCKYIFLFIAFEILTLAAGFGIWMIFHGLWMASLRLIAYWKPARHLFASLLKLQDDRYLQMLPMTWYRWTYLVVYFSIALTFIIFGASTLVQNGFLKQNIIYLLAQQ
jgi:hypothetical protein